MNAVQLALQAQAIAPALRLGIDATEVHSKQEQDARWQQVIDSAVRLQKAARTGEVIAGDTIEQLTNGGAVAEALRVGDETYLLLTGVRDLTAVPEATGVAPEPTPVVAPEAAAVVAPEPTRVVAQETPPVLEADPITEVQTIPPTLIEERSAVADMELSPPITVAQAPVVPEPAPAPAPAMQPTARWDAPVVGRDLPLADLRARFEHAVEDRNAACLLVVGEPGVGRSRLVEELARSVGDLRAPRDRLRAARPRRADGRWPNSWSRCWASSPSARPDAVATRLTEVFAAQADADRVGHTCVRSSPSTGPSKPTGSDGRCAG